MVFHLAYLRLVSNTKRYSSITKSIMTEFILFLLLSSVLDNIFAYSIDITLDWAVFLENATLARIMTMTYLQ